MEASQKRGLQKSKEISMGPEAKYEVLRLVSDRGLAPGFASVGVSSTSQIRHGWN